ncbi:MAG TPA: mechanosensitive ion channel domain-containing protein [Burkholderiales bacterium]|nr:mechanosensitive ion channel domain-containing protein [Burkholderiales bacterium]
MERILALVGPERAVELLGIRLVGVNADTAKKLLITLAFIALLLLLTRLARALTERVLRRGDVQARFWARQGVRLASALVLILGIVSIWFDDPVRLTTALGLVTAGLAFALQKVVTAVAGYFVILRSPIFNVGDRITMGGVRGDVIALGFTQTTIMEMGQPPAVQNADPAMWVKSRQYTGRIVTVSNARIFDEPVYNYTRDFPYLWEEMSLPVHYTADHARAERILLEAAERHSVPLRDLGQEALEEMQRRYFMKPVQIAPHVYLRLTDDWLELTVRFLVHEHDIREQKDRISRDALAALQAAGIAVASRNLEIGWKP